MSLTLLLLAAVQTGSAPCSAKHEIARAAWSYRNRRAFTGTQHIEVRVPGAPVHEESLEYGFTSGRTFLRMPGLYSIELRNGRILITEAGRIDYVSATAGADLQSSLDAAFGGVGSPVIPPPVLLRSARTTEEQMQAFRLKVLGRLERATCSGGEVVLSGQTGEVQFHVVSDGSIRSLHAEIATAAGQPPILADVSFTAAASVAPPRVQLHGKRMKDVRELSNSAKEPEIPGALQDLDGIRVPLRDSKCATVLEFWATWCAPCRMTLPKIEQFAESHKRTRLILVNVDENRDRIRPYLAAAGVNLPTVIDAGGTLLRSLGGGLPLTIVVSSDGRVLERRGGFDDQIGAWLANLPACP